MGFSDAVSLQFFQSVHLTIENATHASLWIAGVVFYFFIIWLLFEMDGEEGTDPSST